MNPLPKPLTNEAQPGNTGMGGFRHGSLHVEVKDGFRAARVFFGQTPPAGVPMRAALLPIRFIHRRLPFFLAVPRSS